MLVSKQVEVPDMTALSRDKKVRLEIYQDIYPADPREEDNLGKMICWHSRYKLGDSHEFTQPSDFKKNVTEEDNLILPLFLYDHSGISMSTVQTYPYDDQWDAGQVGWIYVSKAKAKEEDLTEDQAYALLKIEVARYNDFLTGNVWSFSLVRTMDGKVLDSCSGFYGDIQESGMGDYLGEYKYLLDELTPNESI